MSDTSQGPGWWLASDGKWYPPQEATPAAPPPPAPAPPSPGPVPPPSPGIAPPPAGGAKSGMSGAAKGCLIALAVFALLGIIGVVLVVTVFGKAVDDAVGGFDSCPIISSKQANEVLGGGYQADELKGLMSLGSVALDNRVLADAKTQCWITNTSSGSSSSTTGRIVTVSRWEGGDAAAKFQTELTNAKGTKEDRGGGMSVESMAYFNKTVELGDEAFCTTAGMTGTSGVLVRKGTTLLYISTTPEDMTNIGLGDLDKGTLSTDDGNCEVSQKLAQKALGG